jgi:predicted TIM-barrel fold metal-dependent hydrolase
LSQKLNDAAATWAAHSPKRLIGSFVLPLQDIDFAMKELQRAVNDLSLRVANIPAEVRGIYMGDARFRPLHKTWGW